MGKLNITENKQESNVLGKLKKQLDDAQKTATEVEHLLADARSILFACTRKQTGLKYSSFADMVVEASKCGEKLTEKLRRLSMEIMLNPKQYEQYQADLVEIHGIDISEENGNLRVSLPMLVPHRKEAYTDYIYKPLYTACQHWCMKRKAADKLIPTYQACMVCFVHIYDRELPIGRVRDHDNFEEKHVLDVLSNFFLQSDSGLYVDTCHITRLGEADKTLIYITDSACISGNIMNKFPVPCIEKDRDFPIQEIDMGKPP